MKETGIIMSGSHPVDILKGRKTMTRRTWGLEKVNEDPDAWMLAAVFQDGKARFCKLDSDQELTIKCPYGSYGDRLWVRETHTFTSWDFSTPYEDRFLVKYADGVEEWHKRDIVPKVPYHITSNKVRPSLFMPRWASRILLEITEIRAERLQEISDEDIKSEGIEGWVLAPGKPLLPGNRAHFIELWDSLNAKRGYPWDGNWWVWVIGFRMIRQ